ncbi:tetratricopeptide repeat-containing sensor histidine kinase [Parapedobacter koreensis]|uniref:histidine kinase n=1 Tax=Parapedobacter koreensis TaxID=332977 RepID=A0A1H7TW55_9SPHI|nr:tetratricopeptide repeat-containing sensor histidine kinase [Parapedobacter koreensis]SEL88744.1 Signal transduction histidine kinase [Parapedobacter koreensis]
MRTWNHTLLGVNTALPMLLACSLIVPSCNPVSPRRQVRLAIQAAVDSVYAAIAQDVFTESIQYNLDSIFQRHVPLSSDEKLLKYGFYHWYYTTYRLGDYAHADQIADSALALFQDKSFRELNLEHYGTWMLLKGDALVNLKQLSEAFTYYYQVKSDYLAQWDACKLSQFTSRLGFVRYKQNNYPDAIAHYKQAYAQFCQCRETKHIDTYYEAVTEPQGLLNGIAWFYDLMDEPDSALHYYYHALSFLEQESRRFPESQKAATTAKGVIYGNLGGLYSKTGQYEQAEHYLTESVTINGKPGYDQRDVQTAQIKLADLYIKMGRLADAEHMIADSRKGLDSLPNADFELRWKHVHWQFHDERSNLTDAYAAFRDYQTLKDSIEESDKALFGADFSCEFERREQQSAYTQLAYKNKQNFIFLLVSIVVLILTLAVVYLVYSNWRRSKRHVRRLAQLNDRINQRNEKLQLALSALQDSQQENSRIMAMVAHDLRNPLTSIKMSVDFLLMEHTQLQHSQKTSFFEIIGKSSSHALELIEELMHSYETGSDVTHSDQIDLYMMLSDCVELMQLRATKKEQLLAFEGEPVVLCGSREKIWRVISNLIDNAIKFTPWRGHIAVRLRCYETEVLIEVQDSGIGIAPEFQDRLFEMGKSAGRIGTNGEPSTGLGLAIVKQIVSSHNGRISFVSSQQSGTTFYVHLPR